MIKLLPKNVALLASACADSAARYSLTGVHVKLGPAGYVATATDGHCLVRVEGEYHGDYDAEFPAGLVPALDGACASEGVVPAAAWLAASKRKLRSPRSSLDCHAVAITDKEAAIVATNLDQIVCERSRLVEGRFPDADAVLRDAMKNDAFGPSHFDPALFAKVLAVVGKLGAENVEVVRLATGKPCVLVAETAARQKVTALVLAMVKR